MTQVTPNTETQIPMQSPEEQLSYSITNCILHAERYQEAGRNLHDALDELRDLIDDSHLPNILRDLIESNHPRRTPPTPPCLSNVLDGVIVAIEEAEQPLAELCDLFEKLDGDLTDKIDKLEDGGGDSTVG